MKMTDALIWIVALLLIVLMIFSIIYENRQRAQMTEEQWEAQSHERGASLLSASAIAIDQALRPETKKAAEVRLDERFGMTEEKDQKGNDEC
jgi:preprotein translocase subunit YajC